VRIEFVQCGKVVCDVKTQFSVHDQKVLNEKEQQRANSALIEKLEFLRGSVEVPNVG
jgi:hypothetical protein